MADLQLKDITLSYGDNVPILQNFSLQVSDGELVSLLGPSGCGKTTTLRIIAGLLKPDAGSVLVDHEDIDQVPIYKRRFGMVFQSYALFPHLTVFDNVAFGLKQQKVKYRDIQDRVMSSLELIGLDNLSHKYPRQLSGGQQQRVSLARSLVVRPRLLLMDEPLSNLDAKLRLEMREEIR
ncbi:ABC transporter ATP-binding protein, partial [Lactobacillus sp. XV13L]|nr:ABC transporter ATP-binding protein [Lactobacillus sp. XV13L]